MQKIKAAAWTNVIGIIIIAICMLYELAINSIFSVIGLVVIAIMSASAVVFFYLLTMDSRLEAVSKRLEQACKETATTKSLLLAEKVLTEDNYAKYGEAYDTDSESAKNKKPE